MTDERADHSFLDPDVVQRGGRVGAMAIGLAAASSGQIKIADIEAD